MTLTRYVDTHGAAVSLDRELGRGGQGAVFTVTGRPDMVAKIYLTLPDHQTSRKLDALAQASDPQLLSVSAWPQVVLKDSSNRVHGFVMPLVNESDFKELHMLYRLAARRTHFPDADWRFLVHVARNVARGFAVIHRHGHVMGDVSPRNVMVSKQGVVRFIDTDSFQIRVGGETYPCPVGTAEFTPPELQGKGFGTLVRSFDHDLFGLALLIFHLLFDGRHPYMGVPESGAQISPAEAIKANKFAFTLGASRGVRPPPFSLTLDRVHQRLQGLFERAFALQVQARPTAVEWEETLAELSQQLTQCRKNDTHWHDRRLPCPWCALLPGNAQAATAKTGVPAGAKRVDVDAELNRIWRGVQAIPVPPSPAPVVLGALPSPLPLPAQPEAAAVKVEASVKANVWGAVWTVVTLWALIHGYWLLVLIGLGVVWYQFSKNSASNLKSTQAALQAQQDELNKKHYQKLLDQELGKHQQETEQLRRRLAEAYARQQKNSAQVRYKEALLKLQEMQRDIRLIDKEEYSEITKMVDRHKQPLLERHLKQYALRPGAIPGVGAALIATLNQNGVHTANDIDDSVRWVKGVGPKRQQDLLYWRDQKEQLFVFDPGKIPLQEFVNVQVRMDQKRQAQLALLEGSVTQFAQSIATWRAQDQAIATEIGDLKFGLAQRERTIELIQEGR